MSETPETNKAAFPILSPLQSGTMDVVAAEVARKLERERDELRDKLDSTCTPESFADLIRQRSDLTRQLERSQGAEADCARLVRERDVLRTKVADLESLNRMVGHAADANEKDAIQAHDRIAALMKERDELREALRELHQRYVLAIGNEGPEALRAKAILAAGRSKT